MKCYECDRCGDGIREPRVTVEFDVCCLGEQPEWHLCSECGIAFRKWVKGESEEESHDGNYPRITF